MHKKLLITTCAVIAAFTFTIARQTPALAQESTGPLFVTLSQESPPSQVVSAGARSIEFARFNLTAPDDSDARIKQATFYTAGTIRSSDLQNIELYDFSANALIAKISQLSSGIAVFALAEPLLVNKSSTKTVSIRADVSAPTEAGSKAAFMVGSVGDIVAESPTGQAIPSLGQFPLYSNYITFVNASSADDVDLLIKNITFHKEWNEVPKGKNLFLFEYCNEGGGVIDQTEVALEWKVNQVAYRDSIPHLVLKGRSCGTYLLSSQLPATLSPATYTVTAMIDATNKIKEINESNNIRELYTYLNSIF